MSITKWKFIWDIKFSQREKVQIPFFSDWISCVRLNFLFQIHFHAVVLTVKKKLACNFDYRQYHMESIRYINSIGDEKFDFNSLSLIEPFASDWIRYGNACENKNILVLSTVRITIWRLVREKGRSETNNWGWILLSPIEYFISD